MHLFLQYYKILNSLCSRSCSNQVQDDDDGGNRIPEGLSIEEDKGAKEDNFKEDTAKANPVESNQIQDGTVEQIVCNVEEMCIEETLPKRETEKQEVCKNDGSSSNNGRSETNSSWFSTNANKLDSVKKSSIVEESKEHETHKPKQNKSIETENVNLALSNSDNVQVNNTSETTTLPFGGEKSETHVTTSTTKSAKNDKNPNLEIIVNVECKNKPLNTCLNEEQKRAKRKGKTYRMESNAKRIKTQVTENHQTNVLECENNIDASLNKDHEVKVSIEQDKEMKKSDSKEKTSVQHKKPTTAEITDTPKTNNQHLTCQNGKEDLFISEVNTERKGKEIKKSFNKDKIGEQHKQLSPDKITEEQSTQKHTTNVSCRNENNNDALSMEVQEVNREKVQGKKINQSDEAKESDHLEELSAETIEISNTTNLQANKPFKCQITNEDSSMQVEESTAEREETSVSEAKTRDHHKKSSNDVIQETEHHETKLDSKCQRTEDLSMEDDDDDCIIIGEFKGSGQNQQTTKLQLASLQARLEKEFKAKNIEIPQYKESQMNKTHTLETVDRKQVLEQTLSCKSQQSQLTTPNISDTLNGEGMLTTVSKQPPKTTAATNQTKTDISLSQNSQQNLVSNSSSLLLKHLAQQPPKSHQNEITSHISVLNPSSAQQSVNVPTGSNSSVTISDKVAPKPSLLKMLYNDITPAEEVVVEGATTFFFSHFGSPNTGYSQHIMPYRFRQKLVPFLERKIESSAVNEPLVRLCVKVFLSMYLKKLSVINDDVTTKCAEMLHLFICDSVRLRQQLDGIRKLTSKSLQVTEEQRARTQFENITKSRGLKFVEVYIPVVQRLGEFSQIILMCFLFRISQALIEINKQYGKYVPTLNRRILTLLGNVNCSASKYYLQIEENEYAECFNFARNIAFSLSLQNKSLPGATGTIKFASQSFLSNLTQRNTNTQQSVVGTIAGESRVQVNNPVFQHPGRQETITSALDQQNTRVAQQPSHVNMQSVPNQQYTNPSGQTLLNCYPTNTIVTEQVRHPVQAATAEGTAAATPHTPRIEVSTSH